MSEVSAPHKGSIGAGAKSVPSASVKSKEILQRYANKHGVEIILYSGDLTDEGFYSLVDTARSSAKKVLLVLETFGGSADAAYRCARHLQDSYKEFSVLVVGYCKSAGTILASGANEIIMAPFGELGPLDVQIIEPGQLDEQSKSGANLIAAFETLEKRCSLAFSKYLQEITSKSDESVSLRTRMEIAAIFSGNLYRPIFKQIDPEYIGQIARDMSIAVEYTRRLVQISGNITWKNIERLVYKYPYHGFVIDFREAKRLFKKVRKADQEIFSLITSIDESDIRSSDKYYVAQLAAPVETAIRGAPPNKKGSPFMEKQVIESPHQKIIPMEKSNLTEREQIRILARKAAARRRDLLRRARQKHSSARKSPL